LLDTASKFASFSVSGLKHANSILETFEYICQILSQLILTILSYTVPKLVRFLRHSVVAYTKYL